LLGTTNGDVGHEAVPASKGALASLEVAMPKIAMMLVVAVLIALGAILWSKSTVSATGPDTGSATAGYDVHLLADTKNLPISDVPDAI
jgi:hypothetical protein